MTGMRSVTAVSCMMLMLAGCGRDRSGGVAYPGMDAVTVTLSAASTDPMTSAGDTRLVTAVVKDANGSVIPAPALTWRTSAPSVAAVTGSADGATVTAVDDGTAIITAATGSVEGTVTVTVHRRVVSIELSGPDSVVVAGSTTQLSVVGRDARQNPISGLTGVTFTSSNGFSVLVSPSGLVTALFSSFRPFDSIVTATVTRDGVTLSATKRIDVGSAAPPLVDFLARMDPVDVRPEPVNSAADGIVYFTVNGARVDYKILWSLLEAPPLSAHIHGPDDNGSVAEVFVDLPLGNQSSRNGTVSGSFSGADIHPQGGKPAISLDSLVTLMETLGTVYVDVHTPSFPDGEMRGSIFGRQPGRAALTNRWR